MNNFPHLDNGKAKKHKIGKKNQLLYPPRMMSFLDVTKKLLPSLPIYKM
ncbi:MAG: hypothetical protein QNJ31_06375 [Candidatus Caenarcaniphilales bacterium]|nr:hypothetical protein [Candidatus Caenarcaniphilales bacterium]